MLAHALLALLFALTVAHLVTLKLCTTRVDHRTAPAFISAWVLLGLLLTAPVFGHLWPEGLAKFEAQPYLLALAVVKGAAMFSLFVISQQLMHESLSSRHYVTPLAVGIVAVSNSFFGEALSGAQWFSALGLCALAAGFFFGGHLSELSRAGKIAYAKLVVISAFISTLDHILTKGSNWYALLVVSNAVLLPLSLFLNRKNLRALRDAFLHKAAALAGFTYMATELVKFYQQVTINPVTVVIVVQAMTKPVILTLSALVWKERTVREQLVWGVLAFLVTLPLFF